MVLEGITKKMVLERYDLGFTINKFNTGLSLEFLGEVFFFFLPLAFFFLGVSSALSSTSVSLSSKGISCPSFRAANDEVSELLLRPPAPFGTVS
jgi:hypothetical protein